MGDDLGGRPPDRTCYVDDRVSYDEVRGKSFYQRGIAKLQQLLEEKTRVALMCSESKPEECHRSKLIGETLIACNLDVKHIDEKSELKDHEDVIVLLSVGQQNLFGTKAFTSRNRYLNMKKGENSSPALKILTIGVYGFDEARFFQSLVDAGVDTFCDLRLRRGMRGSTYSFVNSKSLQGKLKQLGIRYVYFKELAPSQVIRDLQRREDEALGLTKRVRVGLGEAFIRAYKEGYLSTFNSTKFIERIGKSARVVSLFCVEREPQACHRSLVAEHLAQDLHLPVNHLMP